MTPEEFEQACVAAVVQLRWFAPNPKTRAIGKSTGNLAFNAIEWERPDANTFVIYVDENIAPYMPYTNEPWLSPRWKGKKNPNEGWWPRGAELVAKYVAQEVGGRLKKGE